MEQVHYLEAFETEKPLVATLGNRFVGLVIDGLVLLPLAAVDWYNKIEWKSLLLLFAVFACGVVYKSFFESKYGATPGKMAMKIRVVKSNLEPAGAKEGILRNAFDILNRILTLLTTLAVFNNPGFNLVNTNQGFASLQMSSTYYTCFLFAGGVLVFTDAIFALARKDKRSLHDLLGDTMVIRQNL